MSDGLDRGDRHAPTMSVFLGVTITLAMSVVFVTFAAKGVISIMSGDAIKAFNYMLMSAMFAAVGCVAAAATFTVVQEAYANA